MKKLLPLISLLTLFPLVQAQAAIQAAPNKHGLVNSTTPFLYVADTSWLLNSFSDDVITTWLNARRDQGFTVMQVAAVRGWDLKNGDIDYNKRAPFIGNNPTRFVPAYWERWKRIADLANARGIYLALHVGAVNKDNNMYRCKTLDECYKYGRLIGETFRGKKNIIYNLGLDQDPKRGNPNRYTNLGVEGYREIARGIADGHNGSIIDGIAKYKNVFMTYHPGGYTGNPGTSKGESSSTWFHGDSWLDSNGIQPGFVDKAMDNIYDFVAKDYTKNPNKPTLLIEYAYDDCPVKTDTVPGCSTDRVVASLDQRRMAWHGMAAGAAGVTYGYNCHWQLNTVKDGSCYEPFTNDINKKLNAANKSMKPFISFFKSRVQYTFIPDQSIITAGNGTDSNPNVTIETRKVAARRSDNKEMYIYYPSRSRATIDMGKISASSVSATWWKPWLMQTDAGATIPAGTYATTANPSLIPPSGWTDAVLIVKAR